jgi:hypothetical protein
MCRIRGRLGDAPGNSLGGVWSPRFIQSSSVKSIPARVLLANDTARGKGLGPKVQRLLEICPSDSSASISIENHSTDMAFCCLGPGHGRGI